MLRSIFKPSPNPAYGIVGWYDLGKDATPKMVERFRQWPDE